MSKLPELQGRTGFELRSWQQNRQGSRDYYSKACLADEMKNQAHSLFDCFLASSHVTASMPGGLDKHLTRRVEAIEQELVMMISARKCKKPSDLRLLSS